MDKEQHRAILRETFNTVAGGYDCEALRFFKASAEHMTALLKLQGSEHVLDVACGTGYAALAIAGALTTGRVTAVDFSPGMLEQARRKAASLGIRNVGFLERDMEDLKLPEGSFDVAVCAFGIFFVDDMERQLSRIASTVRTGGRVMVSNFEENYFSPMKEMLFERLGAYGVQLPPQTWRRIASEAGCRQLFEQAGFTHITVARKNVGYHLENARQWWDVVWNGGFRRMVSQLSDDDRERFRREHLDEVEALRTKDGIWLDVGVLYTCGTKKSWGK